MGYQERDRRIVDYEMYELHGVKPYPGGGRFRGPPVTGRDYIACVGAAQTFGCFCADPYPALLHHQLGLETLNLGYGGAGPTFHASNPRLLGYINNARLVILQVLSARSQSNSLFHTVDHSRKGTRLADGLRMTSEQFWQALMESEPGRVRDVVAETRANYIRDMTTLLQSITPPKILFWFSQRDPDYHETYGSSLWELFGRFPQLVTKSMVDAIKLHSDAYAECVSSRGMPQLLRDKAGNATTIVVFNEIQGRNVTLTHNRYYPSPEMHVDAANDLVSLCRRFLGLSHSMRPRPVSRRAWG